MATRPREPQPNPVPCPEIDTTPLTNWRIRDLRGQTFGYLTVYAFSHKDGERVFWKCWCDCGTLCTSNKHSLVEGKRRSCGCLNTAGRKGDQAIRDSMKKRHTILKRLKAGLPIQDPPTEVLGDPALAFAHDALLSYACLQWANYEPAAHHRLIAHYLERVERGEIKRLMITMPPRHGKRCAHSTPVLTMDGWKTHGELKAGDFVFHPSGNPVEVLAESTENDCDLFDHNDDFLVKTTSGETIRCHARHEWRVFDRCQNKWRVVETQYLSSQPPGHGPVGKRGYHYRFNLPDTGPVLFDYVDLPLDPYFLGVWLGDGRSASTGFVYHPKDREPRDEIERRGFVVTSESTHATTGVIDIGFGWQGIRQTLRELKILGEKNIPEIYLRSSLEQRLDLLAGLIDTDGHVERSTGRVRIATVSALLKDAIVELLTGLGQRPSVFEQQPCTSTSGIVGKRPVFYIGCQPTLDIPTKIPRKKIDRILINRHNLSITEVIYQPNGEQGKCIQVDSPDGLYLVGRTLIPTHNSMLLSEYFPAWFLGRNPDKRVIAASYGQDLASDFGRKVRNQIADPLFQEIFPETKLAEDSAAVDKFNLAHPKTGGYFAVGVGGALTGRGANCLIIDDPIKSREISDSESSRRKLKDWYTAVAYTRLMDSGSVIICQTRWTQDDLAGWLLKEHRHENWIHLDLPAINEKGEALWPERYPIEELEKIKRTLPTRDWLALYQQQPFAEEGGIFKRDWWKRWPDRKPLPECDYVIQSWDTAFSDRDVKTNSYSARTTWGVFRHADDDYANLILLETWKGHVDYSDLRKESLRAYKEYNPDKVIIEKRASGQSLLQDLRRAGLPVVAWMPERDKVTRAYAAQSLFENGRVYYPDRQWAEAVIDELAAFPQGTHDDIVDTVSQAFMWVQRSWLVRNSADVDADKEDELPNNVRRLKPKRAAYG